MSWFASLSPSEASLLFRLAQGNPGIVTADQLYVAVYGRNLKRSKNTIRVILSGLRKRAKELNIRIVGRVGEGYHLELIPFSQKEEKDDNS